MRPSQLAVAGILIVCGAAPALGASTRMLDHQYNQVWSTAIRFVRADRGYVIKDKDRENGYILFIYPGAGAVKECTAALELISVVDDQGARRIRVRLSIDHQPSYVEVHFLDGLEQKLRDEHGAPHQRPDKGDTPKDPPPEKKLASPPA